MHPQLTDGGEGEIEIGGGSEAMHGSSVMEAISDRA